MPDLLDDELLSAYLDGELPAEERARVEQLLSGQPESRQLLEELRANKTSLERMPRMRLGHDFADQVLRQAEKEVLTKGRETAEADKARGRWVERAEAVDAAGGLTWQRVRRPAIWAALALAAGLVIMFLDRDRLQPRQVVVAPGVAAPRGGEIGAPAAVPAAPVNEAPERLGEGEKAEDKADDQFGSKLSVSPRERARDGSAPTGAAAVPRRPRPMKPEQIERTAGLVGRAASAARRDESTKGTPAEPSAAAERETQLKSIAGDETLVVWCYMTPGANADRSFRKLLAQQNIEWADETPVAQLDALGRGFAYRQSELDDRAKQPARDADGEYLGLLRKRNEGQRQQVYEAAEQAARNAHAELVLVEANKPQIEAVLEALDRDSDHIAAVKVEPAANVPEQQQYARYARGLAELRDVDERREKPKTEFFAKKETSAGAGASSPTSNSSPAEAKQSQSQGIARRLLVRSATPPDEADSKPAASESLSLQSEKDGKGPAKSTPADAKKPLPALQRREQQQLAEGRLQVLFVLRPSEAEPPAAAEPADK